eukprot:GEZU01004523.1.p1 GENE.GEZU01004523.1~~GEZU01004523.1.p1  ORF type:complete len:292 (+),score=98.32 GEZU01004523.1:156-1031(+)
MQKLKAQMRQTNQLLKQKMGKAEATRDEEFEELYNDFTNLKKVTEATLKHFQMLIENAHAMSSTIQFISEDFRDACMHNPSLRTRDVYGVYMGNIAESVENTAVIPFQNEMQEESLSSLQSYVVLFDPIKSLVEQRKKLLLEYDFRKEKVRMLTEKSNLKDPLKLPRTKEKMNKAKEDYDLVNEQVKAEMRQVIDRHAQVFEPLVERLSTHLRNYTRNLAQAVNVPPPTANVYPTSTNLGYSGPTPTTTTTTYTQKYNAPASSYTSYSTTTYPNDDYTTENAGKSAHDITL